MKKKCLLWYSKALAAALTLMGFVGCAGDSDAPVMYGPAPMDTVDIDTTMVEMYGVMYAPFEETEEDEVLEQQDRHEGK